MFLRIIGDWRAWVEIGFFWVAIYWGLRFLRSTRGGGVARGLFITVLAAWLLLEVLVDVFLLPHLGYIFTPIAGSLFLAMIILFQPELRQGITRFGDIPFLRRLTRGESREVTEEIADAVEQLGKSRTGALIAFEREVSLEALSGTGTRVDSRVSRLLLESLFQTQTPLHDGAVVIAKGRVLAAGCIFPLTDSPDVPRRLGTRHRAALGVTEETDAVALVASEETGRFSIAKGGVLTAGLDAAAMRTHLHEALAGGEEQA